jgi:ATP-dependent DNA helicase DinG
MESKSPRPPWAHSAEDVLARFDPRKTPRKSQKIFADRGVAAFKKGKPVLVGALPTGAGKSDIAKAFGDVVDAEGGAYMITPQKALQDQYEKDFPSPQMELLKGRSNYGCTHPNAPPKMHAGDAVCHSQNKGILRECVDTSNWDGAVNEDGEPIGVLASAVKLELSPEHHRCPYWKQLQKCNDSKLTLFNFSSFLFQRRIGRFQKRPLLLIDEGHRIEEEIMRFVTIELTEWAMAIIDVQIDRQISDKGELMAWLTEKDVAARIKDRLGKKDEEGNSTEQDLREVEKEALTSLSNQLGIFLQYLEREEWVIETVEYWVKGAKRRKIVGRPLYAKGFANDLLFSHADRVIVMSATILDVDLWARNLGLSMDEVEYVEVPLDFPAADRPIHLEGCGNMGMKHFSPDKNPKDPTKPKFVKKVQQIITRHEGQRGIIHCHSNDLSAVLREEVRSPRFLFQDQFDGDKKAMMEAHAKRNDSIIVAPAMAEGFDFKGDLARFQIIAKIPWPSLGDKLISKRASLDDSYYGWLTALKLVQSYGRICRFHGDWGYTYIVDSGFDFFYRKHGRMLPVWFREAVNKYAPKHPIRREPEPEPKEVVA